VILAPADLALLTGRTRHSAQRRVLDAIGVAYRVRPDGSNVVFRRDADEPAAQKGSVIL